MFFSCSNPVFEEPNNLLKKEVHEPVIYSIEDNMFRFWYRFVPEYTSIIARGAIEMENVMLVSYEDMLKI